MNKKLRLLSFCIALCTIFSGVNAVANSMVKMSDASFFSAFYEYGGDGLLHGSVGQKGACDLQYP